MSEVSEAALEHVKRLATRLSSPERAQLAAWLAEPLEERRARSSVPATRALYGMCSDLGLGPSDADIEEVRREMWGAFPREDISKDRRIGLSGLTTVW